jgi:hypothetical protein
MAPMVGPGGVCVWRESEVRLSVLCWCVWQESGFSCLDDIPRFNLVYKVMLQILYFQCDLQKIMVQ